MSHIFLVSRVRDTFSNAASNEYGSDRFNIDKYKNLIKERCLQINEDRAFFLEKGEIPQYPIYGYLAEDFSCFEENCITAATCMAHVKMQSDKKIYLVPFCKACNKKPDIFKLKKNVPLAFKNLDNNLHLGKTKANLYFKYQGGATPVQIDLRAV